MATKKAYDLAVKIGSYQDSSGNTKGRYKNVGAIYRKDDGSEFIAIDRTFNPAGVPNPDGKESVLLSRFEVRERGQQGQAPAQQQQPAQQPASKPAGSGFDDMEDDIPF